MTNLQQFIISLLTAIIAGIIVAVLQTALQKGANVRIIGGLTVVTFILFLLGLWLIWDPAPVSQPITTQSPTPVPSALAILTPLQSTPALPPTITQLPLASPTDIQPLPRATDTLSPPAPTDTQPPAPTSTQPPLPPTDTPPTPELAGPCDVNPVNIQDGPTVSLSDAHWYTVEDFDNSVNPPVHRFIVQKGPGEVTANSTRGKRAWGCPNQISAQNNAAIVAREYKELKDENNNFMHLDERVYGPDGKEVYTYGKLCQGNPTNCLAPPGVFCALYFYQPGIQDEKTFIFKSDASIDESINIQNYSGTLSCWSVGHTPSLVKDVGTDHKFGTLDEVLKLGVTFSRDIEPVSQYSLP